MKFNLDIIYTYFIFYFFQDCNKCSGPTLEECIWDDYSSS
jgi:hypothetical protein